MNKSAVQQRLLFELTRKSPGRRAILQSLKENSCQYRRRVVDTKVYHHGEFLLLLYDYYIYFNLFCKGFFCYEDIYSMF